MPYNLIREKWITIQRKDGTKERIAPYEITSLYKENPVIRLCAPRPDFNGALIQFLIALLQTAYPPETDREWEERLNNPPDIELLKQKFLKYEDVFNLDGDGKRFMQDKDIDVIKNAKISKIGLLLIDAPGVTTIEDNKDFFIKRGNINCLCPMCAASAIFTLQTNAPEGGRGNLTSLRGGGPLTTIIIGNTIWETAWFNVLTVNRFNNCCGSPNLNQINDIFPWMGALRTSDVETFANDVNPLQMYWAMPRRMFLIPGNEGKCDICNDNAPIVFTNYKNRPGGVSYEGQWNHPLGSYYYVNEKERRPLRPKEGLFAYRNWLGIVIKNHQDKHKVDIAEVINVFQNERYVENQTSQLWSFGYEMESMKPISWQEGKFPIVKIKSEIKSEFELKINALIHTSENISDKLIKALKNAWLRWTKNVKKNPSFAETLYWQKTEPIFYQTIGQIKQALEESKETLNILEQWLKNITKESLNIFDEFALECVFEDSDPKRISKARQELDIQKFSKTNREILGLPVEKKENKSKKKKS